MQNARDTQASVIRRITIDEKLASGLMRILIAELKDDVMVFDDDSSYWREEYAERGTIQ